MHGSPARVYPGQPSPVLGGTMPKNRKLSNLGDAKPIKATPTFLEGLMASDDESIEKIVGKMLSPEDVETKTEIHQPLALTQLETMATWCLDENCVECHRSITTFIHAYRINMVSFDRQSRKEVERILTEGMKTERALADKLASRPAG